MDNDYTYISLISMLLVCLYLKYKHYIYIHLYVINIPISLIYLCYFYVNAFDIYIYTQY